MRFCGFCGQELSEKDRFCSKCGKENINPTSVVETTVGTNSAQEKENRAPLIRNRNIKTLFIAILILILLVISGVYIFANKKEKPLCTLNVNGQVNSLAYSPDGKYIATGSKGLDGTIVLWDANTGAPVSSLKGNSKPVFSLNFSPTGKYLVSVSDKAVVWDLAQSKVVTSMGLTNGNSAKIGPNDEYVVFGGTGINVYRLPSGRMTPLMGHHGGTQEVNLSTDGNFMITTGRDKKILIWDAVKWRLLKSLETQKETPNFDISPNSQLIGYSFDEKSIKIIDIASERELRTLSISEGKLSNIAFSPDGNHIASIVRSTENDRIVIWDLRSGKESKTIKPGVSIFPAMCYSPQGDEIAIACGNQTVQIFGTK